MPKQFGHVIYFLFLERQLRQKSWHKLQKDNFTLYRFGLVKVILRYGTTKRNNYTCFPPDYILILICLVKGKGLLILNSRYLRYFKTTKL